TDEDVKACFLPDILVNVHTAGLDSEVGVIRDVSLLSNANILPMCYFCRDGMCKVSLGASDEGDTIMVTPSELKIVRPRKNDHVKILGGSYLGFTGKLVGIDGLDAIVKIEDNIDIKILALAIVATFVQP
ncbi:unnamed protein product, partial [Arabidopsis halleri]